MKSNNIVLLSWVALCVGGTALAQTQTADPVAGTWTGHMGPAEPLGQAITIEMKRAGSTYTGKITGPGLTPGDISDVEYDRSTGALKFVVVVGDAFKVTFDGNLAQGVATGRAIFPDQTGLFRIVKGSVPAAAHPVVQVPKPDPATEAVRRGFTEVSGWVTRAADLVPPERYSYKPTQTVRSFGELVGHIADAYLYYCGRGAGRNVDWTDAIEKGGTAKATVVPKLRQALETCNTTYNGSNAQIGPLMENIGHTSLHYGNIVTYMRMMGLVPPSQ